MTTTATHPRQHVPIAARHPAPREPKVNGFSPVAKTGAWPHRPRLLIADADVAPHQDMPSPSAWCGALARAAVEVALGGRPPVQLVRWLLPEVYERLAARAGLQSRIRGNGVAQRCTAVRAIRICEVDERTIEACAAVWDGWRIRAVAMRLEARRARWLAVELVIG